MQRSEFHYDLPPELIAQTPLAERAASRLLVLDGGTGSVADRAFADLPELLRPGDLLVFNDTRVLPARLIGRKPTGGRVELLLERLLAPRRALMQLRASHVPQPGGEIELPGGARARVLGRADRLFELELDVDAVALLEAHAGAAAALYRSPSRRERPRALSNRVCACAGRRRRADGGVALRSSRAR
jgi:S-adenosylmethionine:tRNA ribosyltransferase-isomerase